MISKYQLTHFLPRQSRNLHIRPFSAAVEPHFIINLTGGPGPMARRSGRWKNSKSMLTRLPPVPPVPPYMPNQGEH